MEYFGKGFPGFLQVITILLCGIFWKRLPWISTGNNYTSVWNILAKASLDFYR